MPRDPEEYQPVTLEQLAAGAPEVPDVPGQLGLDGSMLLGTMQLTDLDPQLVSLLSGIDAADLPTEES